MGKTKKRSMSSKYTGKMDTFEENVKVNMRNKLIVVFNDITKDITDIKYRKKLMNVLDDYFKMLEMEIVNKLIAKYGMVSDLERKLLEFYGKNKNLTDLGNEIKKMAKMLMAKSKLTGHKAEMEECAKKYAAKIKI